MQVHAVGAHGQGQAQVAPGQAGPHVQLREVQVGGGKAQGLDGLREVDQVVVAWSMSQQLAQEVGEVAGHPVAHPLQGPALHSYLHARPFSAFLQDLQQLLLQTAGVGFQLEEAGRAALPGFAHPLRPCRGRAGRR